MASRVNTMGGRAHPRRVRPLVGGGMMLATVVSGLFVQPVAAQNTRAWRAPFAQAQEALEAGEHATYAERMAEAVELIPADHLNRPFVQYHAARAAALLGDRVAAVRFLQMAWDDQIESLMISFTAHDPAFDGMRDDPAFQRVLGLAATMELEVHPLGGAVYEIVGAGSTVLAQVGEDGAFLVDTGYRPALPALRRALESIGAGTVRRLLVTHPHEDHMASVADFGDEAVIFAHPGTAEAMDAPYVFMEGVEVPVKPMSGRPDVEVASDTSFVVNGETVRIFALPAHTGADLVVYFSASRVAHFGDAYLAGNPMIFPGNDDPDGFLDRAERFLASMHPDTRIVLGHKGPVTISDVQDQINTSRACMALVRGAIEDGLTQEETVARADERFPPQWIGFFYRLFSADR